jgi:uncharacterized protein (TIRG00374 family)
VSTLLAWSRNSLVRPIVTVLLVALIVVKTDPQRIVAAANSAQPGYLLGALLLTFPFLAFKASRWYLMLRGAGVDATVGEAASSLVGGMGLALVTPARLGEVVRGAYLRSPEKMKIAGLVLLDKGFDVLVLCALSVVGAWELLGPPVAGALALATGAGLAIVYVPRPFHRALQRLSTRLPGEVKLNRLWSSLETLTARDTTAYIVLTALSFAVVLVQFGIVLLSWRAWSFNIVILTFPLVILTNVLPITIGGLGVREGAAALLLSHYGVSVAHAEVAAFLMFAMNTGLPGLAGALLTPLKRLPHTPEARPAGRP